MTELREVLWFNSPKIFNRSVVLILFLISFIAIVFFLSIKLKYEINPKILVVFICAGIILLVMLLLAIIRSVILCHKGGVPPVSLCDKGLCLPVSHISWGVEKVSYKSLKSFGVRRSFRRELFFDTGRRLYSYPLNSFRREGTFGFFEKSLKRRICDDSDSCACWRMILKRGNIAERIFNKKPYATIFMVFLIAVIYLVQRCLGTEENPLLLIDMGANSSDLVDAGQWFRLFSGNFLHANLLHFVVNVVALFSVGRLLEKVIGSSRFLIVFFLSALGGTIASHFLMTAAHSVGASTAIFGLLGGLAVVNIYHNGLLPSVVCKPIGWWLIVGGVNFILPFFPLQIDYMAHAGGFLVGTLSMMVLCRYQKIKSVDSLPCSYGRGEAGISNIVLAGLVILFVMSFAKAVLHFVDNENRGNYLMGSDIMKTGEAQIKNAQ